MRRRIEALSARFPWLVAESSEGRVVGYAYASPYRARSAYRWAVDVAVYVSPESHRGGIGRALYEALFERLMTQGFRMACAGITLPNLPSIALHEKLGFVPVGVYRQIGWKFGTWHDVAWYQRELATDDADPPAEPTPVRS